MFFFDVPADDKKIKEEKKKEISCLFVNNFITKKIYGVFVKETWQIKISCKQSFRNTRLEKYSLFRLFQMELMIVKH